MKELLLQFATYNHWAHTKITDAILDLDDHLQQQVVQSSFPNLYATILHMWDAESVWFQRMKGHEKLVVPSASFNPTMKEAVNGLLSQAALWQGFIQQSGEEYLAHVFEYRNSRNEQFKQPLNEVLLHVFNHGTYHRGQLVTMMRELGVTSIPQTDFIVWARQKS